MGKRSRQRLLIRYAVTKDALIVPVAGESVLLMGQSLANNGVKHHLQEEQRATHAAMKDAPTKPSKEGSVCAMWLAIMRDAQTLQRMREGSVTGIIGVKLAIMRDAQTLQRMREGSVTGIIGVKLAIMRDAQTLQKMREGSVTGIIGNVGQFT